MWRSMWIGGVVVTGLVIHPSAGLAQDQQTQQPPPTTRSLRGSWLTDRQQLQIGDIVTVVIDERVTARERISKVAQSDRRTSMGLNVASPDFSLPITAGALNSNNDAETRNLGQADRRGDLTSVFTVSIVGVEPTGLFRIEGERTVVIDGRRQEWALSGLIRPEDVSAENLVFSNRIANASINYKGKDISPSRGLISKILSIFWP